MFLGAKSSSKKLKYQLLNRDGFGLMILVLDFEDVH